MTEVVEKKQKQLVKAKKALANVPEPIGTPTRNLSPDALPVDIVRPEEVSPVAEVYRRPRGKGAGRPTDKSTEELIKEVFVRSVARIPEGSKNKRPVVVKGPDGKPLTEPLPEKEIEDLLTIANDFVTQRERMEMSNASLSKRSGVSIQTLHRIQQGTPGLSIHNWVCAARAVGCQVRLLPRNTQIVTVPEGKQALLIPSDVDAEHIKNLLQMLPLTNK